MVAYHLRGQLPLNLNDVRTKEARKTPSILKAMAKAIAREQGNESQWQDWIPHAKAAKFALEKELMRGKETT